MKNRMSTAHNRTRKLIKSGDQRSYKTILCISLRVVSMTERECTVRDINYLKLIELNSLVDLSSLRSLHKANTYNAVFHEGIKTVKFYHSNLRYAS